MHGIGRLLGCPTSLTAAFRDSEVNVARIADAFGDTMSIHVLMRVVHRALSVWGFFSRLLVGARARRPPAHGL